MNWGPADDVQGNASADVTLAAPYAPGEPSSGLRPATLQLPSPASLRARFADRGVLGRGGMGVVRRVFDTVLRREVALKHLAVFDDASISGLLREAQVAAALAHPNIVPIYDLIDDPERGVFYTMMLVEGGTLEDLTGRVHGDSPDPHKLTFLVEVVASVCDAIAHAHDRGIVHGDLTPRNVLVTPAARPFVTDWGLAVVRTGAASRAADPSIGDTYAGTPAYMAPEQWRSRNEITERTDVYGIGGLLYHVLTGLGPHEGATGFSTSVRTRTSILRSPREFAVWPRLPVQLVRTTMKALAPRPMDRHASVVELRAELQRICRSAPVPLSHRTDLRSVAGWNHFVMGNPAPGR